MSVLYFAWVAHEAAHPGLYFIAMNYTVHSVMYSYYFLMALDAWPKSIKYVYLPFSHLICVSTYSNPHKHTNTAPSSSRSCKLRK